MHTSLCAILPNDRAERPSGGFPTIYLLHGLSDDHTTWTRFTSIERYAIERGIAVIMPEVQHSFYTDMKYGIKYFTYVSDELPRLAREMFALSVNREDAFVAGLSMGGYGALKCALSRPDVFSAGASLSGAVNIAGLVDGIQNVHPGMEPEIIGMLGNPPVVTDEVDVFKLTDKVALLPPDQRPRIMTCCGTEDFLYQDNQAFKKHMEASGLDYKYAEGPGVHEWKFWDKWIVDALDFFLQGRAGKR
jgi:putative tributyrin esterase